MTRQVIRAEGQTLCAVLQAGILLCTSVITPVYSYYLVQV
ncbi:hypothetical protein E2C01_013770 [Portunus trituberculatus]|uniref:Uncharacterized protein n=1 Tax=Portunus trituberculatus TaxID=210409 RepID=A0A5B7DHI4_PORTR|nr:hypothetical protein [Portunus trituberculatus]